MRTTATVHCAVYRRDGNASAKADLGFFNGRCRRRGSGVGRGGVPLPEEGSGRGYGLSPENFRTWCLEMAYYGAFWTSGALLYAPGLKDIL